MATETHSTDDNTPFVESEVVEYRSISVWAVLALLLAIASPLVFISPLFNVLSLASCLLAVTALLKIRSSGGTQSGVALARWAAILAIACMVAAPVRTTLRDHLLLKQADKTAQHWLALLAEDRMVEAVRNLNLDALQKLAGPPARGASQQQLTLQQLVVLLRNDSLTSKLIAMQKNAGSKKNQITRVSNSIPQDWKVQVVYEISSPAGDSTSAKSPKTVAINLQKQEIFEGQGELWLIANWIELAKQIP